MPLTYQVKLKERTIAIKALKKEAEAVNREFQKLIRIRQYFKEIYGIVGQKENTSTLWSPWGPGQLLADEATYQTDLSNLISKLPDTLTPENWQPFIKEARELFDKHLPIVDKRRTQAEEVADQAEMVARQASRDLSGAEWRAQYCQDNLVPIPQGMMAVYLEMSFDDSYSMTDYFAPHRQVENDMLLAIVPKQAEREALARRILALYPELSKLAWEWKTENYSMGHGNYLISEWTDHEEAIKGYDGREKVNTRWEIRMNSYTREMLPYKDYPGQGSQPEAIPHNGPVTIRRNEAHNGIEVLFPDKPEASVLDNLKSLGFRWSKYQGLWYARYSESLLEQVTNLLNPI